MQKIVYMQLIKLISARSTHLHNYEKYATDFIKEYTGTSTLTPKRYNVIAVRLSDTLQQIALKNSDALNARNYI